MTDAYIYLRVSSQGQVGGDGFPRQREACYKFASAHKIQVLAEFQDGGVSGSKDLASRPGLSDLMVNAMDQGVKLVLVESMDRLARSWITGELIIRDFQKEGIRVIAALSGQDLTEGDKDNPQQALLRHLTLAIAEYEKSALVRKLRLARERVRRVTGSCEGRKAFGHRPHELEIIKEMRAIFVHKGRGSKSPRCSFAGIARQLNESGYRTWAGSLWHSWQVQRTLKRDMSPKQYAHHRNRPVRR